MKLIYGTLDDILTDTRSAPFTACCEKEALRSWRIIAGNTANQNLQKKLEKKNATRFNVNEWVSYVPGDSATEKLPLSIHSHCKA